MIPVLVHVLAGPGQSGTTCFRCERDESTGAWRACPLRTLASPREATRVDAGDAPAPETDGDEAPATPERR